MSAQAIVSTILPILGLVNGLVMLISPTTAAKKIYKFNDKESIKPQVVELVQANGASSFSLGVAEMLLSFTNISFSKALSISTVPRVCFLIYSMTNKTKFGAELSSPSSLIKLTIATALIEGKWLGDETRSMQFRGGFYLLLGILFTLVPSVVANKSNQFDANPTTERCLRARGKVDSVFGTLAYCLATMSYTRSLGYACLSWFVTSLYGDILINSRDRFRSDAFVQLFIVSVSAAVLLSA